MIKTPEQKARNHIGKLLEQAGWVVADMKSLNWSTGSGIAIREHKTTSGHVPDYPIFVDKEPVGSIEGKKGALYSRVHVTKGCAGFYPEIL